MSSLSDNKSTIEVRGFSFIKEIFDERGWSFPVILPLEVECTAKELADKMDLPSEKIEAAFINGVAGPLDRTVQPGDRVAFIPPGTPGPYRVILGIVNPAKDSD